jgi:prepilin-type N-terminal cleavage/methylation domain-containing protein
MRKKLKGFTLIELIIVMAILAIMMAAIMKFFEPIRMVYNDATYYEQRRSVTNSMVKYTTESIRYAKYLAIFDQNDIGTRSANAQATAIQAVGGPFKGYMSSNSIDIPVGATINVIELNYFNDYAEGLYNTHPYYGRLYRTKLTYNGSGVADTPQNTHLAFGQNYYNANNYNMQWAYEDGKFEAYASSYNEDDGLNNDGIVVRSVAAVVLKNVNIDGKVFFTDAATSDGLPDILSGTGATLSTLLTTGTNIPYGKMSVTGSVSGGNAYYLVWIDADQF